MKVLVLGNGAREHTLAWAALRSPLVDRVYCAPGNAGTGIIGTNLDLDPTDGEAVARWSLKNNIDLVIIGPEVPLMAGVADVLARSEVTVFGPKKQAAMIEGSKGWAKEVMSRAGAPTAQGRTFSDLTEASEFVRKLGRPMAVKADGLAAGKGVIIPQTVEDTLQALQAIMDQKIVGEAGSKVILEEVLHCQEISVLAFTDGQTVVPMVPACDYKRVGDNDEGPNTGGMGAYSPCGFVDEDFAQNCNRLILEPVIKALAAEGILYQGVLYAGLMVTDQGPMVLEFNARFGDPETQVILPRLKTDLIEIMLAVTEGKLAQFVKKKGIEWRPEACCGVVMAAGGYPGQYAKGDPISGLDDLNEGILVFHAGTKKVSSPGGQSIVTDGGRVLTVTALGKDVGEARAKVYENIKRIHFANRHYRTDIALRELK